jgi:hypothetical protein
MNWKIAMLEVAQLGAFVFALWIPFRLGRAAIRKPWPMLAGWFALVACGCLFIAITWAGAKAHDHELANAVMEGPGLLLLILLGWLPASFLGASGEKLRKKQVLK